VPRSMTYKRDWRETVGVNDRPKKRGSFSCQTLLILKRIHKKGREEYFKENINITLAKAK